MKEGVLVRKHLLELATQKAKHRDWRECFSVVGDGELKMYTIQGGYQQINNKVSSSDMDRRSLLRASGVGFNSSTDSSISKSTGTAPDTFSNGNKWGVRFLCIILFAYIYVFYFLYYLLFRHFLN
jgi:hypothetical protein